MKLYEIRASIPEYDATAIYNDTRFPGISQASSTIKSILSTMQNDRALVSDDLALTLVRISGKKSSLHEEPIVQLMCGLDEDTGQFCYEGIYYFTACSEFERMILMGENRRNWIGQYGVEIAGGQFCFFSDLQMILDSIQDLRSQPETIINRVMSLVRKQEGKDPKLMAQLLYAQNEDGSLRLQSRVGLPDDDDDGQKILQFIRDEQNQEKTEDAGKENPDPVAEDGIEDIEAAA